MPTDLDLWKENNREDEKDGEMEKIEKIKKIKKMEKTVIRDF